MSPCHSNGYEFLNNECINPHNTKDCKTERQRERETKRESERKTEREKQRERKRVTLVVTNS